MQLNGRRPTRRSKTGPGRVEPYVGASRRFSGPKPVGVLRNRHDTTCEHQHADGPDQERDIAFIGHDAPRCNPRARLAAACSTGRPATSVETVSEIKSIKTRAATYFPQRLQIRQSSKDFIAAARHRGDKRRSCVRPPPTSRSDKDPTLSPRRDLRRDRRRVPRRIGRAG